MATRFEILGEISNIETIAVGTGIRERARLRRIYGRGSWRSAMASPKSGCRMAQFTKLSYIGMKQAESGDGNSK